MCQLAGHSNANGTQPGSLGTACALAGPGMAATGFPAEGIISEQVDHSGKNDYRLFLSTFV